MRAITDTLSAVMTHEQVFAVSGMDCANCARSIETGVARLDGVATCALAFHTARLRVQGEVAPADIIARVAQLGYSAVLESAAGAEPAAAAARPGFVRFLLARPASALALAGALLVLPAVLLGEILPLFGYALRSTLTDALALCALGLAGWPIARSAWRQLAVNREIGINLLMTIAACGAVVLGAYGEGGLVMVLFALGEALEGYTAVRARDSIQSLLTVAPAEAIVLRPCIDCQAHLGQAGYTGGPCPFCGLEEQRVPVDRVIVGDMLVVHPGERIAMDGRVSAGVSQVNQAPITGESMPVDKQPGSVVYAGSINGDGALQIVATSLASDSTIARIVQMVERAQERRAPVQRFVDRFARIYTPAVVVCAALVAVLPPLLTGAPLWGAQGWLYRALALLVVACPCALVVSTPVSLISALANAARHGVLLKGGAYLEELARVSVVAFDKTGTLTEGRPQVTRVRSAACVDPSGACAPCDELLSLASAVERRSQHPLARAVVREAEARALADRYAAAEAVTALNGRGLSGMVAGRVVLIGSHQHFDQAVPHAAGVCAEANAADADGQTALMVGVDDRYAGYITISDRVREGSREALARLARDGIQRLVMLTGDSEGSARRIAGQIGVTDVLAGLMPEHKQDAIARLRVEAPGARIAMVGDGVNDAPALATADVGIAMGGTGSAQAMETADVVLMRDDIGVLPGLFALARAAMRTIRFNIAFAIGIKIVFFALVLAGLGTLWMAVFADVGASMIVTLNGMRLLRATDLDGFAAHRPATPAQGRRMRRPCAGHEATTRNRA